MKYLTDTLQDPTEIEGFCEVLRHEEVRSYLEIGSKFGGSLWKAANALPKGSRIVSVDMPSGTKAWPESRKSLSECVAELQRIGYSASIYWGDSQSDQTVRDIRELGPFDCVMIDADHRLPGVTKDWNNYGPMSSKLVAFHDISWRRAPDWVGVRIDVPQFWNSIKGDYRHKEIVHCPTGKNNGIGVLWKN
jgi:hypothetical protein